MAGADLLPMKKSIHNALAARALVWLLAGLLGGLVLAGAEPGGRAAAADQTSLSDEDRAFLLRANRSLEQQVTVSRGLVAELVYPEVREYAYLVMTDEPATKTALQELAARKGVSVPPAEKITFRKWARGDDTLDRHYVRLVAADNEEVSVLFEKAALSRDADIARYATRTLPIIRNHLKATRDLKKMTQ